MYVEAEEVEEEEEEGVLHSPYSRVTVPEATSLSQFVLDRAAQHGQKVAFVSMACWLGQLNKQKKISKLVISQNITFFAPRR